jgi:hypothetical protein
MDYIVTTRHGGKGTLETAIWKLISSICRGNLFVKRAVSEIGSAGCARITASVMMRLAELCSWTWVTGGSWAGADVNVPKSSSSLDGVGMSRVGGAWDGGE